MRSAAPLTIAALVLTGCAPEVLEIELPRPEGTRALLIGVQRGARLDLQAVDPDSPPPSLLAVDPFEGPVRLFVLAYPRPLEALGLEPGRLLADPDGEPPPAPRHTFERSARPGDAGAWAEVEALSPDLAFTLPARPPDLSHCPTFEVEVVDLGVPGRVLVALADDDGVFALNVTGHAFRIDGAGVRELAGPWPILVTAGVRTSSGAVWLGDGLARVHVGTPEAGFALHGLRPHGQGLRYMAVPDDPSAPFELFVLSRLGHLERYADGAWRSQALGGEGEGSDRLGDLVWLGPDEVAAIAPQTNRLDLVRRGRRESVEVDIAVYGNLSSLARLGGELFGATGLGHVLRFEDGVYVEVAAHPGLEALYDVIPFAGGILLPGEREDLRFFTSGKPACAAMQDRSGLAHQIWTTVRWRDEVLAFTAPIRGWDEADTARVMRIRVAQ